MILGQVTDGSGAVLPGATVRVEAIDAGVGAESVTDGNGLYTPALKIGSSALGISCWA